MEKGRFQRQFEATKAKMNAGFTWSQATAPSPIPSPPTKPSTKKKKNVSRKKSPLPKQSNKVTFYLTPCKPKAKDVSPDTTEDYPVFNTIPANVIWNFRYPQNVQIPIKMTPVTELYCTVIYYSNTMMTDNSSKIKMNKICARCKNTYCWCMERKWRKICLNRVVDDFEDADVEKLTEDRVRKAYYDAFLFIIKT